MPRKLPPPDVGPAHHSEQIHSEHRSEHLFGTMFGTLFGIGGIGVDRRDKGDRGDRGDSLLSRSLGWVLMEAYLGII